jgi:hypothetical protein
MAALRPFAAILAAEVVGCSRLIREGEARMAEGLRRPGLPEA